LKPSDIFGNGKDKKPDKTLKDFVGRLQKVETKKNIISKRKKEETELEVQRRFAKLRASRAKERHGPVRTGDNSFSYGDVDDEITDEEIEHYCLGTTDPDKKATILADPANQHKKQKCEDWKRERDSTTKEEKREARQRVHHYCLIYDDDDEEQIKQWELKREKYQRENPNWKTWF
jgi:hypothetical protein